jgi:carbamoyltransferase
MKFLGLRLCDHDSNITYTDGTTVRYIKSERLKQIKHHGYNNFSAWIADIQHWNIDYSTLDGCAICVDQNNVNFKIDDTVVFQKVDPFIPNISCPTYIVDHHFAHALSCWPIVNTEQVTTDFVFDGFGDFDRSHSIFKGSQLVSTSTKPSVGALLTKWGEAIGVEGHPLDISGKVMAMKSFGAINYQFLNDVNHCSINEANTVFDILKWLPYKTDNNKDWLASLHKFIEDKFVEQFLKYAYSEETITFSGGVAQNICVNAQLKKYFKNLYIPPHNPDDGLSLGCVELLRQLNAQPKFDNSGFPFWQDEEVPEIPTDETIDKVAQLLADGKIVGWFQGKGEIGPRALGNRSILMRPDIKDGKDIINNKVKHRENYRPFGCSVLEEYAKDHFDCDYASPFMLYSVPVKNPELLSAITHIDGTSRIQTVNSDHKIFQSLLEKFHNKTGLPILLNTSLNTNKKPIASTKEHAMGVFETTGLDVLCVGNTIYIK